MSKTFRKLIVMLLVLTVTLAFSGMSAFADGEGDETTELTVVNNYKMFVPKAATLVKDSGAMTLELTYASASYDKAYVGTAEEAVLTGDKAKLAEKTTDGKYMIPVENVNETFHVAFHSVKNEGWYNRTFTIDLEAKTLTTDTTDAPMVPDNYGHEDDEVIEAVNQAIRDIQVQNRTEDTDAQCAKAKELYDALTDEQKEKLEDPGYFGDYTGDASADDPLNQDNIGENELLVVSFGTSFNESRATDIGGVEKALQKEFPDWSVRRAFTAQIIINHVQARDGVKIDNMQQALDRAVANGVKRLVIQPTHLMHGAEYDELVGEVSKYQDKIDSIEIAEPLLGEVGKDATEVNNDKETAAKAMVAEAAKEAGFDSIDAMDAANTAIVFMGHGTGHKAAITYSQMQEQMKQLGYKNVFVGTVEGNPAETALPEVKKAVEAAGYTKVILRPMMVVAGDHATNDMAADEEGSWYYGFVNGGNFTVEGSDDSINIGKGFGADNVTCQIKGLGRIAEIQKMYVAHTNAVINPSEPSEPAEPAKPAKAAEPVKVTMTVNDQGTLAKANDGSYMAAKEVTVEDTNVDGTLTYDEALQAAHKAYNKEDGFAIADNGWVLSVWGVENNAASYSFYKNNKSTSIVTAETVEEGDYLVASINKDADNYRDWYTYFTSKTKEAKVGNKITLTLKGHYGMGYTEEELKNVPLEGITIKTADGEVLGTTDKDGKVTFRLYKKGTYVITAEGTVSETFKPWGAEKAITEDCPIVAPVSTIKVVVKEATPKVTLSKTSYVFNGKVRKPGVTVVVNGKELTKSDYTVKYGKGRKNVGKYSVKVTLKNNYKGSKKVYFKIKPTKASIKNPVAGKKKITVKWKAVTKKMANTRVTGYQVQVATNKAFTKNKVSKKVKGYKKTSKVISGLKANKTYYVRVRTYKTTTNGTYYSNWSTVKKVKTKK